MAFTATLLSWSVIDFGKGMGAEQRNAVKTVKWATDYLLKATAMVYVQVGDPYSDHNCWERPEDMDTLRTAYKIDRAHPGSNVAGETAAALAAASIVFRSGDPAYPRLLLDRAVKFCKLDGGIWVWLLSSEENEDAREADETWVFEMCFESDLGFDLRCF